MFKRLFFGVFLFALLISVPPQNAQAASISEILTRMDEIIKQMQSLRSEFNSLSTQVGNTGSGSAPVVNTKRRLTLPTTYGETNDDIALIQKLLATDPLIYPYQVVSGFFGPKTQEAIKNFQSKFGLDPIGVVGPSTTELLEAFFAKYPDDNFPSDALAQKPVVTVATSGGNSNPKVPTLGTGSVISIVADEDYGEAEVTIKYANGNISEFYVDGYTRDEIVDAIVKKSKLSESLVNSIISFTGKDDDEDEDEDDDDDSDYDEDDAEDALDSAEEAVDDAADEIDGAETNGEDVDWANDTLEEAEDLLDEAEEAFDDEDYDEAVDLAEEAEDLADESTDRIGEEEDEGGEEGDNEDIESIEVEVNEGESEVTVKYEEDDDYEFTVDSDYDESIIEEVADELDLDEDEVEDLIEFDYGAVDVIDAIIDEEAGETEVTVNYESGVERDFTLDVTDEEDVIAEIADLIDEDEEDVEEWVEFDYN